MSETLAAIIWGLGIAGWLAVRLPRRRKAKRLKTIADRKSLMEQTTLGFCIIGLFAAPLAYWLTGWPEFADRSFSPIWATLGGITMAAFVVLFRLSHKQLDKNWSVTLEVREDHQLVQHGLYAKIRHPMYTSFWLWGIAQLLLVPNWIMGAIGLLSVAILFFTRINNEEAMMRSQFGDAYDDYCKRTKRLVPGLY